MAHELPHNLTIIESPPIQSREPASSTITALTSRLPCLLQVTHVEGSVDPVRDLEIIHNELLLKDIAMVQTKVDGMRKNVERKIGGKVREYT